MRCCVILLAVLVGIGIAGCRKRSVPPPEPPPQTEKNETNTAAELQTKPNPAPILDRMVNAYQTAAFYSDKATVQIIGKMTQPNPVPAPQNCSVIFQKPNQIRLTISDGTFVSDGKDCYAHIQSQPDQVLHHSAPENLTIDTLFQEVHLDHAMALGLPASVLRFPPQLILLFACDPLNTFCPNGAQIDWLEPQSIGQIPCEVIRISHSDGNRILWISQENNALLRLDYQPVGLPVPESFASIEAIRIEMTDAQFSENVSDDTFQFVPLSPAASQVTEFQADIPGLPTPEEHRRRLNLMMERDTYRLVDQQIESAIPAEQTPTKTAPKTFKLLPMWKQPLVGGSIFALQRALQQGNVPKLLIPCEGNLIAVMNLQGEVLQKISPKGLENSIITGIQISPTVTGKQRIGILTLDGKFFLYDESFTPLSVSSTSNQENSTEEVRDFQFVPYNNSVSIVFGIQKVGGLTSIISRTGLIRAVDEHGIKRWEQPLEGNPNQVSAAVINRQERVLVSRSAAEQDFILTCTSAGTELDLIEIPFGRHILWFQFLDSTVYTLLEDPNTGDVRFAGLNQYGKGLWSRLLPAGDYEVEPVFVPKEQKWFVPLPNGEIMVFDLQGNVLDKFSLNMVPTGLFCVETAEEILLFVADGESVSAWKME